MIIDNEHDCFTYDRFEVRAEDSLIVGYWSIGERVFIEKFSFPDGGDWSSPETMAAARMLYLMAGVSYYKTAAPTQIVLPDDATDAEIDFLKRYYQSGLGEFAYRADESAGGGTVIQDRLLNLRFSRHSGSQPSSPDQMPESRVSHGFEQFNVNPLVPFGGGVDSLVTVELLRSAGITPTLFIVSRDNIDFPAVNDPAKVTGLRVLRANRTLDPALSEPNDFLNGHVPVTGIISAMAILTASLFCHDSVVMSNEWSASSPTVVSASGNPINHQYSKSIQFERDFSRLLAEKSLPQYFSLLRPRSELWIAREFSERCQRYFTSFCSCNRAFLTDPSKRSDGWCNVCDKCAFIDLILAPFMSPKELGQIFAREPLRNPDLLSVFEGLAGIIDKKPWECVGDVLESASGLVAASERPDRKGDFILQSLAARASHPPALDGFMGVYEHLIPERYLRAAHLD